MDVGNEHSFLAAPSFPFVAALAFLGTHLL